MDNIEEEGGDMEEEIDRYTSAMEGSTQPSSQAQAQGPDHLDRLIARVKQMYGMLETHVKNTSDQFIYAVGQITALSSQIDDMMIEQQWQRQEGYELESEAF